MNIVLELVRMDKEVRRILDSLRDTCDFSEVDLSDINACSTDGDNALHVIVRWGDLAAAGILIEAGINVNKAGDLGYTPLHVACMEGNLEMVKLLTDHGADLFALSEGEPPFTSARLSGADQICDFLAPLMKKVQDQDPNIWCGQGLRSYNGKLLIWKKSWNLHSFSQLQAGFKRSIY